MNPLILYGGTFNPIHQGHMALCSYLHQRFRQAEILLMPAALPPHKPTEGIAAEEHRLEMCRIAAQGVPYVTVGTYEIHQKGKSYTIDTLRYLSKKYPGRPLYLLMGSDMLLTFRQWRQWQEIGKLATLLGAMRHPGDRSALKKVQQSLKEDGVEVLLLDNPPKVLSSTRVRFALGQGRADDFLPEGVGEYILDQHLYQEENNHLVSKEKLRRLVQGLVTPERYCHVLAVEEQAVYLAQKFGADPEKAARCGILHDICKNMSVQKMLQLIMDDDIMTGNQCPSSDIPFERQPQLLHSHAGAVYLRKELGIEDQEILDAVRYHTTARGQMSTLEKVVYLADLTSKDRTYPDVDTLRALTDQSLEKGMAYALQYIVMRLARDGDFLCRDTVEAYNEACGYNKTCR